MYEKLNAGSLTSRNIAAAITSAEDFKSIKREVEDDSEAIRQELINELTRLELSLNEAKIVVRLVSRGPAIASDISKGL
jgi:hypothetical protein